jgi:transposase-like protein
LSKREREGWIVSSAAIVATRVDTDAHREILCIDPFTSGNDLGAKESKALCMSFLREMVSRGLWPPTPVSSVGAPE